MFQSQSRLSNDFCLTDPTPKLIISRAFYKCKYLFNECNYGDKYFEDISL